jgi:hypothetical protein
VTTSGGPRMSPPSSTVSTNRHAYLHKSLRAWAETYRDGVRGKERIVVECAMARPLASTQQDDFVGRLLWALSDPGGSACEALCRVWTRCRPLDWLELVERGTLPARPIWPASVSRRRHVVDKTLAHLQPDTRRPSPYPLAPCR